MCARITCETCGKPTWAGCGQHVEEALAGVMQVLCDMMGFSPAPMTKT